MEKKLYYTWSNEHDLHCAFFTEENKPINSQLIIEPYILKPILLNGVVVEGATQEEVELANKPIVPESISRMHLKIELLKRQIEITDIIDTINSIPDSMFPLIEKRIAIIKFNEAVSFDRYNADLNLIGTLIGLTQEDLDDIFINGNII